jgi:hypothetical protein
MDKETMNNAEKEKKDGLDDGLEGIEAEEIIATDLKSSDDNKNNADDTNKYNSSNKAEDKDKDELKELVEDTEETKLGIKDYKLFGIVVGVILLILIAIFAFNHFYKPTPKSINDLHAEVLAGKEDENHYMYNSYSFVRQGSDNIGYMWYTQVMNPYDMIKYDVPLHYGPKQLEDVPAEGSIENFMSMMYGKNNYLPEYDEFNINTTQLPYAAYFSFDPKSVGLDYINLAHHELRTNLLQVFDVRLLPACTNSEDSACDSVAVLTCQNTTLPIIVFQEAENSSIMAKGNCITVSGVGPGIVKSVDKLMYIMYGIMK